MRLAPREPDYALQWFLTRLIPDQVDRLNISIYMRRMEKDSGRCWTYQLYPRKFTVVIDPDLPRRETLRTIAHESAHIMQYATGKMKDVWRNRTKKVIWRTKVYENSYRGSKYLNAPWEIEARSLEERLVRAYLRHLKKNPPGAF